MIAFRIMHFKCQIFDSSGKKVSFMVVTGALTGCKWGMHSVMPLLDDVHRILYGPVRTIKHELSWS